MEGIFPVYTTEKEGQIASAMKKPGLLHRTVLDEEIERTPGSDTELGEILEKRTDFGQSTHFMKLMTTKKNSVTV
jgi:hypothetical protein